MHKTIVKVKVNCVKDNSNTFLDIEVNSSVFEGIQQLENRSLVMVSIFGN